MYQTALTNPRVVDPEQVSPTALDKAINTLADVVGLKPTFYPDPDSPIGWEIEVYPDIHTSVKIEYLAEGRWMGSMYYHGSTMASQPASLDGVRKWLDVTWEQWKVLDDLANGKP